MEGDAAMVTGGGGGGAARAGANGGATAAVGAHAANVTMRGNRITRVETGVRGTMSLSAARLTPSMPL